MDIKTLEKMAKGNRTIRQNITLQERCYYIALRGLYSQYKAGEIDLEQAEDDKEVLEDVFEMYQGNSTMGREVVHLNKKAVIDAVILELGRYISCGATNADREKAYPRHLFEKRIVQVIDEAYGVKVS